MGGGSGKGGGGQDGCERRINFFLKIQKTITFFFWGGGVQGRVGRVGWDQGGCEQRIELKFL